MKYSQNKIYNSGKEPELNDFLALFGKTLIYGTITGIVLSGSIIGSKKVINEYLIKPTYSYMSKK
ncbi:hypothetical protein HOK68_02075 [Candidatus Woesearchaeota archaeon]|jgi:hypothetical protein|nr:hypothetical protein [Candidatus Woesearchaeota archaeon]MBT4387899.1 hypothetical protein [Candidatus Woesearchaeota archaeon]MBT4595717.1 hypothetical protein [Candidatus Woesearchaeota archaeon]MBT5741434.1 hypothetical protein [Candidatus Woesearchaeota archaeon]MBT6505542.1 hypothetical protein [Candidatus Woesearchaeota archaeon]